jgi:MFS family permease
VLKGWATRSFFIVGIAVVAWLPLRNEWRMAIVLALLTAFNAARGISACGFLPWMTQWIPEEVRGRFLSRDQMATALASAAAMLGTAWYMGWGGTERFGVMFLVSYVAALASLYFLRRIPDVPVTAASTSKGPVPWKAMMLYSPFLRFMIYNVVYHAMLAGASVLWVPCLRDALGKSDGWVLGLSAVTGLGAVLTLLGFGRLADRVGSRPLLGVAGLVFLVHFLLWASLAARWLVLDWYTGAAVGLTAGVAFGLFNLANLRLAMATVPVMGRSHFFALFSVLVNLTLGILPVGWGWLVDRLAGWRVTWGGWEWNAFSALYAVVWTGMLVNLLLLRRLIEAKALSTDEFLYELVVRTPARGLSRLLPRRWVS